ncbi:CoA-transferase family III domain-containing protein [Paraphoma chrysanthemicola]|uniref:CoA-transferase family III domain-containing protein n=1 Tax=Paraphoma chrysanthemicola TaxID=798071 RepID=A0A8K0R643_9PLEO|nr:CoA-transferase family III domain-containing protein [Paraphoma chrysanthemicola]
MAINGINGHANGTNGVHGKSAGYSIPEETRNVFQNGILDNPLIAQTLPSEIEEGARTVRFEGTDRPSLPINWRFAESISALKGLEASMVNVLLKKKYGVEPQEAVIDTDHAQLFFMSVLFNVIDPEGEAIGFASHGTAQGRASYNKLFKNCDLHGQTSSPYRAAATNIYRCKDGRFFHLHGSMNPEPSQDSVGLPHEMDTATYEEACAPYQEKMAQIDSAEMQRLASDVYKQAGTIGWTTEEFKNSEHGKANAHVGLYEIHNVENKKQPASWWPDSPETSARRPLAGLKVVDLTRIIAAPAMTRGLAELGASVMRVTAEHICDMSNLHIDLGWGKWSSHLDFRKAEDLEKLHALIREADVVVQGYRPDVLNKYGLSMDDLLELTKDRERGLIVVRENCYGWNGPWSYRSGWQQISDACCGVSTEFGRAMGNDEPVTPVFPNSDFCTGTSGVIAVLNALLRRGTEGGSYKVDVALNYYSQWLVNSVGVYPRDVWEDVWTRNGRQVFRHYHNMGYTLPRLLQMIHKNSSDVLLKPEFFEIRRAGAIGKDVKGVKPIVQYPGGKVKLGFNVGTRGNGVDQPRWPADLMTEVVA